MRRLARVAVRRPGPIPLLVAWAVALVAALVLAPNAREQLRETDLQIPGTASTRAAELTQDRFGGPIAMAILIQVPPAQHAALEREGPRIVRELARIDGVQVLSPWARGGARVLREPRGQALLTLQVRKDFQQISDETTPAVQDVLERAVRAPLSAELTGLAPLMRAINERSLDALHRGELIALPVLFVMLLLIFRSPVAALVPLVAGLLVTRIGVALMGVIGQHVAIDALALNMVTMIGLALGVDYSLLVVSRFREELAAGRSVEEAVEEVVARAGRTVLFAGTALAVGMLAALLIVPGQLLVSATVGVLVATVLAVLVALLAMPAGLALLGHGVDRWRLGPRAAAAGAGAAGSAGAAGGAWTAIAQRALRRPGAAAFFVLLPLLLMALPAVALDTGPPHVANLPSDDAARRSYEAFERDRGAGWASPVEVVFAARGPITTSARLRALKRFQRQASRLDGVAAVLGPADLLDRTALLRRTAREALDSRSPIVRLERGLRRTTGGAGRLRDGVAAGAGGAQQLADGLERAAGGAGELARGVERATPQTRRLADGVARTRDGAERLTGEVARAAPDVRTLQRNVDELARSLRAAERGAGPQLVDPLNDAQTAIQAALRDLGSIGPAAAADPKVLSARESVADALIRLGDLATNLSGTTTQLATDATAARAIARGVRRLRRGLVRLEDGSGRLADGIAQTSAGAAALARGIVRLEGGTAALDAGLRALLDGPDGRGGARALAAGLQEAVAGTNALGGGTQRMLDGVVRVRERNDRRQAQLRDDGADADAAISSGWFVLAAIDGARPQARTNVAFATDAAGGGATARVIVVPRGGPFDDGASALRERLERTAQGTARALDARVLVGGPTVLLDDFDRTTTDRFPLLVLTLVLVTFAVLLLLFRSLVLAFVAVALNLVTVGAALGVLVICFQGDAPLLGGPGYLDAIALSGIFAIVFGLSIDYEVFLISRLLEGRAATGSTDGAIRYGLERTATIVTGAAVVMAAVFLAFAFSPVTNTRQFGVGLTVAVLLDATVVRLILLPALIRLFGERAWPASVRISDREPTSSA